MPRELGSPICATRRPKEFPIRAILILLLLAFSACSRAPDPAPLPEGGPYRDTSAPIASRADLDWSSMSGDWTVIEGAPLGPLGQPGASLSLKTRGNGGEILIATGTRSIRIPVEIAGPGRLRPLNRPRELWILWADTDYRTVAIGTPDGAFGWIMDRNAASSRDRMNAARAIMAWYGYDLAALKESG